MAYVKPGQAVSSSGLRGEKITQNANHHSHFFKPHISAGLPAESVKNDGKM